MAKRHDLNKVLKVGGRLFRKNGFHDTGTEEILEQAGFPRSSFYYHFKNKDGFATKVLEAYGTYLLELMTTYFTDSSEKSYLQRLRNYFTMIVQETARSNYESSCLVLRFTMDLAQEPGPMQEAAAVQFQSWVEATSACVRKGQETGEIRDDIAPEDMAQMLFASMFGQFNIARLRRKEEEFQRMIASQISLMKK